MPGMSYTDAGALLAAVEDTDHASTMHRYGCERCALDTQGWRQAGSPTGRLVVTCPDVQALNQARHEAREALLSALVGDHYGR